MMIHPLHLELETALDNNRILLSASLFIVGFLVSFFGMSLLLGDFGWLRRLWLL